LDEVARYNKERWEALAQAGVMFSRPFLELEEAAARQAVDPQGVMGDVQGKAVLCLAGGGGQQSVAFALLGAQVTVFDLSETMLQRDRETAAHYNLPIKVVQGDMRALSTFADDSFDIVWHAYSIDFVPDVRPVFSEVARVLRPGGLYRLECHNPFVKALDESEWDGTGYPLRGPYVDCEVTFADPHWTIAGEGDTQQKVVGPREFRHTLSTLVNELVARGFVLLGLWEGPPGGDINAEPGTWEHFIAVAPPWLTFWARLRPEVY